MANQSIVNSSQIEKRGRSGKVLRVLAVRRDDLYSPNNVAEDLGILQSTAHLLGEALGVDVPVVDEPAFASRPADADIYISMGRMPATLAVLSAKEREGRVVVNSSEAVRRCVRSQLDRLMRSQGIAMPPLTGTHGVWIKRGDAAAQTPDDVVYCPDAGSFAKARQAFLERGITDFVVSAHVEGDVVKFYGVGTAMFRCFYPGDDGISKFGDERLNGKTHHYPYDAAALHAEVVRLASLTGTAVYGGDAIVDKDGRFYIIDFNDWPSFSRCRDEAAEAICRYVVDSL